MGDHLPAIDLGVGRTAAALTAGGSHACAWLDGGVIKCWGRNQDGQLGLGDADNRGDGPDEMGDHLPTIDLAEGVLAVAAGLGHTCALLDGGAIKCWGVNADGQLGLGDARTRGALPNEMAVHLPTVDLGEHRDQTEPRSVIGIALGFAQSCGLLSNGAVKCWGSGEAGALGSGDVDARGDGPNEMADALAPIDFGD
jgi:alpha-tubulin suppressor-like RCC1 family protein